jgi:hypothetical protein
MIIYQVRSHAEKFDVGFSKEADARAAAERLPRAEMITWNVWPNLPRALPAMRYSSCALNV